MKNPIRAGRGWFRTALAMALMLVLVAPSTPAGGAKKACAPPPAPMKFAKQTYVDMNRAGGEPSVQMHPDGTYLYGAHAGTTHFYTPAVADADSAAFVRNYHGQAYYWWSEDRGKTWNFSARVAPPNGVPGSGFSDPDFAVDAAGQVYISEINLANVSVSRSSDGGRTYQLQNPLAQILHDRQWKAADQKDVLYIVGNSFSGGTFPTDPVGNSGHVLYKSTDGGQTFSEGIPDAGGLGDMQVDQRNGTLYEAHLSDGTLSVHAFRGARKDDFEPTVGTVANSVSMLSHWPSIDVDDKGNVYIVWDEDGSGDRAAGVYYSYSTDGRTWAPAVRVDADDKTDIWPWLAVGDEGKVAIAWLGASEKLPDHDPETSGDHTWQIVAAQTLNGLGCAGGSPAFRVTNATKEPVHTGTICNSGTVCQAQGVDRRMGDYFSVEVDNQGHMWAGYSDTRQGGAVALPGFVRQKAGPKFR